MWIQNHGSCMCVCMGHLRQLVQQFLKIQHLCFLVVLGMTKLGTCRSSYQTVVRAIVVDRTYSRIAMLLVRISKFSLSLLLGV